MDQMLVNIFSIISDVLVWGEHRYTASGALYNNPHIKDNVPPPDRIWY